MFRSKPNTGLAASVAAQCRKHPKHKQSPGVCSLCVTQRLVKISSMGITRDALCRRVYSDEGSSCASSQMTSYSSSSDVSSDVSSCVSPGREVGLMMKKKKKEKSRFWTRLALISTRKKKTRGYFGEGKLVLSHSEPLPTTITTAT